MASPPPTQAFHKSEMLAVHYPGSGFQSEDLMGDGPSILVHNLTYASPCGATRLGILLRHFVRGHRGVLVPPLSFERAARSKFSLSLLALSLPLALATLWHPCKFPIVFRKVATSRVPGPFLPELVDAFQIIGFEAVPDLVDGPKVTGVLKGPAREPPFEDLNELLVADACTDTITLLF